MALYIYKNMDHDHKIADNAPAHKYLIIIGLIGVAVAIAFFSQNDDDSDYYKEGVATSTQGSAVRFDEEATESYAAPEMMDMMAANITPRAVSAKSTGMAAGIPVEPIFDDNVPQEGVENKIIKNGSLSLLVTNLTEAVESIRGIAKNNGGDIMNTNFSLVSENTRSGFLTIKVPSDKFDTALNNIKDVASVVRNESSSTRDVTAEFVDTEAELTNKREQQDQLRTFFDKATNVSELIQVEQQLTRIRGEIERIEGRLKNLGNQTAFSTITVNLSEDVQFGKTADTWRPIQVIKDSFNELISRFQDLIDNLIKVSISSLPIFLVSLVGLWILYRIGKKVIAFAMRYSDRG